MKKIGIIFFVIIISAAMVLLPMAPAANAQSPTDTPTPTPETPTPDGSPTATPELVYEWLEFPGSWAGNVTSPVFNFEFFCNGSVEAIAYHEHGDSGGYSWVHNGHWNNEYQDYGVRSEYRVFGHLGGNDPAWIAERVSELQPFDWTGPMPSGQWGDIGWYGSNFNTQFQMSECCGSTGNRVDHIQVLCHHEPTPEVEDNCSYDAIGKYTDLMAVGSIAGSTTFFSCGTEDQPRDCIDFTVTAPLPGDTVIGNPQGNIFIGTSDLVGAWPIEFTVTINDLQPVTVIENTGDFEQNTSQAIPLPSNTNTVTVHVTAVVDDIRVNHELYPYITIDQIMFKAFYQDTEYFNQLCDPGKELPPDQAVEYWKPDDEINLLNRINSTYFWHQILYDSAACGLAFDLNGGGPTGSHNIYQEFEWLGGGTMYWKFRWKNFFFLRGNPYLYLVDSGGNQTLLYGDVESTEPMQFKWTIETGSISLAAGTYWLMTSTGAKFDANGYPVSYPGVAYDDMAIGRAPQDSYCEDLRIADELPDPLVTPTPGVSGTPTLATGTTTASPYPSVTSSITPTWQTPIPTISSTPRNTTTPYPSRTPNPSATWQPSKTPYGEPWVTSTPWYATVTPGGPTLTPGGATPIAGTPNVGGDPPPTDWGELPGGLIVCDRPTNPWSISWWIDYETCRVISFFQFGPVQIATAQALPQVLNTYEPFYTVSELKEGIHVASTRVASYNWDTTGDNQAGVNDPIDPSEPLNNWGNNPWAPGGQIQFVQAGGSSAYAEFSTTCYNQLATQRLTGRLAEGFCFVIAVYRQIGYLSWIQWLLNIASILGLISALQVTIGMYSRTTAAMDQIDQIPQGDGNDTQAAKK